MSMSSSLTKRAIELCKAGNKQDAQRLLMAVLHEEPTNQTAWNWYIETLSTPEERIQALEEYLAVNPDSWQALRALSMLKRQQAARQAAAPSLQSTPAPAGAAVQKAPALAGQPAPAKPPAAAAAKASQGARYRSMVAIFSLVLLAVLLIYTYHLQEEHNSLDALYQGVQDQYRSLQISYEVALQEKELLQTQLETLSSDYTSLNIAHNDLSKAYNELENRFSGITLDYVNLDDQYSGLLDEYESLQGDLSDLKIEYHTLTGAVEALRNDFTNLYGWYTWLQNNAVTPPYIAIHNNQMHLGFYAPDGSVQSWSIDVSELERAITTSQRNRENPSYIYLDVNGSKVIEENYQPYIDPGVFQDYVPALYYASGGDDAFIQNVRKIVSQLTIYSAEDYQVPRHPLETFLMGGGDSEDISILLSSLLLAAPVDWDVRLVFMDTDHPQKAQAINHVLVYVDTGGEKYLLEPNNPDSFWSFETQGWSLDVSR